MEIAKDEEKEENASKRKAKEVKALYKLMDELLKRGHKAVVSSPAAFYALELLKKYPKAKLILTVHEKGAKVWFYEFQKGTQIALHRDMVKAEYHRLLNCQVPPAEEDLADCTGDYDAHSAMIREKVKPDQLLEFKVDDGWEPLCNFLGVPVPSVPFPASKGKAGTSVVAIWAGAVGLLLVVLLVAAVVLQPAAK